MLLRVLRRVLRRAGRGSDGAGWFGESVPGWVWFKRAGECVGPVDAGVLLSGFMLALVVAGAEQEDSQQDDDAAGQQPEGDFARGGARKEAVLYPGVHHAVRDGQQGRDAEDHFAGVEAPAETCEDGSDNPEANAGAVVAGVDGGDVGQFTRGFRHGMGVGRRAGRGGVSEGKRGGRGGKGSPCDWRRGGPGGWFILSRRI